MTDIDRVNEADVDTAPKKARRPRGRSPAYPAIDLEKAVFRVGQLYKRDKQFPISVNMVASIWGYSSLNGPASLAVSALKKFGLIEDEGARSDRTITVSDLAVQILNHPSSDAKAAAIKRAALNPPIHLEMWQAYGLDLPSDANLEWRLTRDRGFTETGAKEFIREYRETIAFAQLDQDDASPMTAVPTGNEIDPGEEPSDSAVYTDSLSHSALPSDRFQETLAHVNSTAQRTDPKPWEESRSIQSYPIPIALQGRPPVIISGAFPLTSAEWDQFKVVLDAMKPVLVKEIAESASGDSSAAI